MSKNLAIIVAAALLSGCGFSDGKKYVLYDPAQRAAADAAEVADAADAADAAEVADAPEANSASVEEAMPAAEPTNAEAVDVDRIFLLENTLDELGRAIRDGLEPTAALIQKRDAVELELSWRKRAAGETYEAARKQRIEALQEFATRPPPKS